MRCSGVQSALAVGSATLIAIGAVGCSDPLPGLGSTPDLEIVAQVEIGSDGAEVAPADHPPPADPAGDGNAVCPPLSIAMAGPLDGADSALGADIKNGIQLAVDKHNAANQACQVQLKPFDTQGDPQRVADLAGEIVDDAYTVGLVGPSGSGAAFAVGDQFSRAGLVATTPSATAAQLSARGWRTFFRGVASNAVQGPAVANYMSGTLGYRKVCVVDDSSDYGLGLASFVRETLGPMADPACNIAISAGDHDFAAVVPQITGAAPDAVFLAGFAPEAAPLIRQLRDAGFQGAFVTVDGALADEFVQEAQAAASDAVLSCPCAPAPAEFIDDYRDTFGQPPGPYAVEAYDLGTILLKGIDSGAITRPALLEYVHNYDGQGIARRYSWSADGELADPTIWIYRVQ